MPKRVGAEISVWCVTYGSSAQKFVNNSADMEHDERYVWR